MIIAKLTGQMNSMAKHKFASNVCEKALVTADSDSRRQLIDEIMTPKQDGLSPIASLMKDSFGSEWSSSRELRHVLTVASSFRLCPSEGVDRGRGRPEGAADQQGPAAFDADEEILQCLQQASLRE